jgi:hypothetical protein
MKNIDNTNYKVDFLGNVYGLDGRVLKPTKDNKGYLRVGLTINGKLCTKKVHRLIAQTFISNTLNKPFVNHINGIKNDNRVENLEWVTAKENTKHAIENGLFYFNTSEQSININTKKGSLNGMSILNEQEVIEIRKKFKPRKYTRKMLSLEYNVTENCIKDIIIRKSWKHI